MPEICVDSDRPSLPLRKHPLSTRTAENVVKKLDMVTESCGAPRVLFFFFFKRFVDTVKEVSTRFMVNRQ